MQARRRINGNRPWDIQVHNENLYRRIISKGSIGIGEAYMDRWWDAEKLDEFLTTDSAGLTKVIDTTKERKQRELTGKLWNA